VCCQSPVRVHDCVRRFLSIPFRHRQVLIQSVILRHVKAKTELSDSAISFLVPRRPGRRCHQGEQTLAPKDLPRRHSRSCNHQRARSRAKDRRPNLLRLESSSCFLGGLGCGARAQNRVSTRQDSYRMSHSGHDACASIQRCSDKQSRIRQYHSPPAIKASKSASRSLTFSRVERNGLGRAFPESCTVRQASVMALPFTTPPPLPDGLADECNPALYMTLYDPNHVWAIASTVGGRLTVPAQTSKNAHSKF